MEEEEGRMKHPHAPVTVQNTKFYIDYLDEKHTVKRGSQSGQFQLCSSIYEESDVLGVWTAQNVQKERLNPTHIKCELWSVTAKNQKPRSTE